MRTIGIVGYGYVGAGMQRLFDNVFDIQVHDPARFLDHRSRINRADLAIICVPTPSRPDGTCDTSIVEEVCGWVEAPLVLIKSTVVPGTTDRLNVEDRSRWDGRPNAPQTGRFHFSPEYMGEPRNFVPPQYPDPRDARQHPWVTVGGPRAGEVLSFFAEVMATSAQYVATTALEAEVAKYMENAYYATKVAFVNEFYDICAALGADWWKVRELWLRDPRVDPDHTLVHPNNRGFGGKCLPKDLAAIVVAAYHGGYSAELLTAVLSANEAHRSRGLAEAAE